MCLVLKPLSSASFILNVFRGPSHGDRGEVLLSLDENGSSKLGVRFDKPIQGGVDLGGLCEQDHGFFCSGNS